MYDLTDFQSYQDYFKAIAESHVALGEGSFLFGDDQVAVNEGKVWKGKKLWLEPYQPVTLNDQLSDNYLQEKKGSLWIGGAPPNTKFQARFDFFKDCEVIVTDIISKMLKDRSEELLITRLTSYKFGMGELTFSATSMVGCRFDFSFQDPSGFAYDEDKWT
ncbi:MAG TPA: hypothetical protein VK589_11880 [Chryseolinea sp.]|nr:hypothetical protein [Chryseolinea sp.]